MIRVGVHGATGRMGRLVLAEVEAAPDLTLAWTCGRKLAPSLAADVIVDFSAPEALLQLLEVATCPVVTGTTGLVLSPDQRVPVLHAANFSVGVAVLARAVREATRALPGWDVEIVELHHSHKRDAPSGTALRLAEGLGRVVTGRKGARGHGEVGVHAVRGGDVVGEHTVYLCGPGERLQLGHVAQNRAIFAKGALRAARWLVGKPAGLYRIEDVLS
ncbi:MAG: 4-hydroxy-tetrahydrodipicolinate reductase [Myxococcota bacterium]